MNEHLLRHTLAPAEYAAITEEIRFPAPVYTNYWDNIPEYLIARCPLCDATYTGQLDTYSLRYWVRPEHGKRVFTEFAETIGCNHFVRTHQFINLNDLLPTELNCQKTLGSEVPYVHPFWLPDDVRSYAVMHALPICRPEGRRFVPRYSLYAITYYSEDPAEMLKRRWEPTAGWNQPLASRKHYDPDDAWDLATRPTLMTPRNFPDQEEIFDLLRWVRAGKLQWLDPHDPDLSLRTGPVEAFPYANIRGCKKQRVFYQDGQVGMYPT